MKVDKIYVILLHHSKENIEKIQQKLNSLGIDNTPYEITYAHNGHTETHSYQVFDWEIKNSDNSWWNRPILPGEVGCTISHINVWKKIIQNNENNVLVLEEDFNPKKSISSLEYPFIKWDFIYLGRNKIDPSQGESKISKYYVYPSPSYNSHAYIVSNLGARKLLNGGIEKLIIPVDEYFISKYHPHPREDVREFYSYKYNNELSCISTPEDYISQTSNYSNSQVLGTQKNGNSGIIELSDKKNLQKVSNDIEETPKNDFEILSFDNWEEWCDKYISKVIRNKEYDLIVDEIDNTNILEFPLFTEKFTKEVISLAESKNKWQEDRHDHYPTVDVEIEKLGLKEAFLRVVNEYIRPLCIYWWGLEGKSWEKFSGDNFIAKYTPENQSHLSLHHDFSDISMVVKLNDEFNGGGTYFPKYKILSNPEEIGKCTLHPGQITHKHGARPITEGVRYVLVSFLRSCG